MTEPATFLHTLHADGSIEPVIRPVFEHERKIRIICGCGWNSDWNAPEKTRAKVSGHLAHFWGELVRAEPAIKFCVGCGSATREPVEVRVVDPGTGPMQALYSCIDCLPHTVR